MEQLRKKIVINVMMPFIMALIVLGMVMTRPTMIGVQTVNVFMLLLTGSLFGIGVAQTISVLRKAR